jgi:arabinan endo-1,5-alpha-L-arabinosidase
VTGRRLRDRAAFLTAALMLASVSTLSAPSGFGTQAARAAGPAATYENPLKPTTSIGEGIVESCADPSVIWGQEGEGRWYMYCTTDPLNDRDRNAAGGLNFHLIPQFSSSDLVNWRYEGDAFSTKPAYAAANAGLWAPEIKHYAETGTYRLFYTVNETNLPGGGSAIGVASSPGPLGPWTQNGTPVVEPHEAPCCAGSRRWVFDPEVLRTAGPDYIYYGSYFGGISVRVLSEDGSTSNPATQRQVAIDNKFEGAEIAVKDGFYYLFLSATDCCRGPLTGYSVFVGRATSPLGPFIDRDGRDLNVGEAGGTPVLSMSSDRISTNVFVGPGHNTVLQDFSGQWWTIYHAVDRTDPYFEGSVGFTKRPAMLDPLDWDAGWPVVRAYHYVSSRRMPAPAAQPGTETRYRPDWLPNDRPTQPDASRSDEFNDAALSPQWTWVRPPAPGTYGEGGGVFRFDTQAADLFEDSNNASVLTEPAPPWNYLVEAKIKVTLPPEGCCFNYVQGGLVIYRNDDNFTKLVKVSIWNTRQTEWAKEVAPVPAGYPRYGNTIVGPPAEWTYLRIVRRIGANQTDTYGGNEYYTAYTSIDGTNWRRGGTWTHRLGDGARIGLVSMGGSGFQSLFDYVRVYKLDNRAAEALTQP